MQTLLWWTVLAALVASSLAGDDGEGRWSESGENCDAYKDNADKCEKKHEKCKREVESLLSSRSHGGGKEPHPAGSQGAVLISRGRPTNHVSQWAGDGWQPMLPWRAVDGIYQTNIMGTKIPCSITLNQANPWWILDLQGRYYVHSVLIWGRSDGYPQTLPILVQTSASGENWEKCSYLTSQETHGWPREAPCNSKIATRVKLTRQATDHLTLCEVEVFGVSADVTPGAQLISRGKPVQQSPGDWSASGWAPMYAYYGNDGNYQSQLIPTHVSCAITQASKNPWWRVNLQLPHRVHDIHIYGRSDGYPQAMPLVIETSRDDNRYEACQTLTGREEPLMKANCKGVKATFVRITRLVDNDVLSLCEVEIFGFPAIKGVTEELTFISRGKPSSQSSTYDWVSLGPMEARFANDGAYDTNIVPRTLACAITELDAAVSWTVNLQGNFKVHSVHIWGRSDPAQQLLPLRVETSLNDWDYHLCGDLTGTTVEKVYDVGCNGTQASFVRISRPPGSGQDYLTLCEVDVIGKELLLK